MKSMTRLVAIAAAVSLAVLPAAAQAKKALTFDDFIKMKRVTDPQPSPDGRSIAFVITVMDQEANRGNSDIWIVPAAGGEPRRLTSSPASDFNPRWSPDGRRLAFVSSRSGAPQIWMIDPTGGEAWQVTTLSTGASGIVWSADGRRIAFTSSVYPDCPDDECNKKKAEAAEKSKVKGRVYDRLFFRYWNAWRDGTRSHVLVIPAEGGRAVDVSPGDFDAPPVDLGGDPDYAFSPDGREVAFVRNTDPALRQALGTNNDLFLAPTAGGPIQKITINPANDNNPVYSPDGKYLAYRAMARPGYESDKYDVMLFDRTSRIASNLTAGFDAAAGEIVWARDSAALFFTADDRGRTALFRCAVPAGKPEKVLDGKTFSSVRLMPDGRTFIWVEQAFNRPPDIWSYNPSTKASARVTDVNREILAGLDMNPAEEFWFKGAGGDQVHGFILRPPAFNPVAKYPLVMLVHGGPHGPWQDAWHWRWNAQMFAARGYAVALINFHASSGYGQKFSDDIVGDWGGKPYDDVMAGYNYLTAGVPYIDAGRTAAAGASYGGYLVNWIAGHTTAFRCLISHDGVYDLTSMWGSTEELWFPEWELKGTPWTSPEQYTKMSPSSFARNFKTPMLVIHGANDFRVPLEQGLQLFTALQRMNVPSKLLIFPDEDHFVSKPLNAELWWKTMLDWLAFYFR